MQGKHAVPLHVLYLAAPERHDPWLPALREALPPAVELAVYDPARPVSHQLDGVGMVVDHGGTVPVSEADLVVAIRGGLRVWQVLGVGVDHLDSARLAALGLTVAHTPGDTSATALAEHALWLAGAVLRRWREVETAWADGRWSQPADAELAGRTLFGNGTERWSGGVADCRSSLVVAEVLHAATSPRGLGLPRSKPS